MELNGFPVAVIGGGLGGVAAAAVLAQRGASVTVYEQAPAFEEVGAGLQISANGRKVLTALGAVPDRLHPAAVRSTGTNMRDGSKGRHVAFVPPPKAGPTWYMHRADILNILVSCAEKAGVQFEFGAQVQPDGAPDMKVGLIVAADGGRSSWRAFVDGPTVSTFSGQVAWRALVPWDGRGGDDAAVLSMGQGAHVVSYPLRGGTVMNLVAVEERNDWDQEGWRIAGAPDEFRSRFSQFGGVVGELIDQAYDINVWALHLRDVAKTWAKGNVALLGDAAHPTLPFMAQGACLALEDAWVLADALTCAESVEAGLQLYQNSREARARRVVDLARGNAWRFHLAKPWSWGAQAVLAAGAGMLAKRLDWVYGYDATSAVQQARSSMP